MWHTSALGLFVCRDFYLKTSVQHVMMCHRSHRRVAKMRISHTAAVWLGTPKYLIIHRKNSRRAMFTAQAHILFDTILYFVTHLSSLSLTKC